MNEIALESYAKINLALDILYKRDDGYHEINTIMQQIDLKDRVVIRNKDSGIDIQCNNKDVPIDRNNLVYKAWEKIREKTGINRGVGIIIDKKIPIAAGLAGGSSNGGAVLKGLNLLWDLNLSDEELMEIGKKIGADVPFCIMGGTAWARGIGEKLTKLKGFSGYNILLANVGIPVSTEWVYKNMDLKSIHKRIDIEKVIKYMEEGNLLKLGQSIENVMESVVMTKYPQVKMVKEDMIKFGALGSLMSGSGPTVFGLFDDEEKLYRCKRELEKKVPNVFVTKTL
ncbi:4-(cytidine 5'-diphospho)-2-C-methyl-D-erythritol kinase [Tepidimicrobium xylanilyticum]|uniref:4-diphosphocytidyl-2-C-methyl-D-erythritol kinase n=1 Tax=Tepidimicrobium xylanilyticum TaxID=1123352 RepID=A0A1H2WFT1_9FIRM|nr:4-(cytidine 5'-diphospho)-2-C-methyl-D-erythritol kinase [Tepidimicrobium xylanilyticum]SDW79512.1 4-diphosphocytidyl-2-C-methyl-D-erythritol kinase [Tepidimicrobium xylanilyticum]